MLTCTAKQKYEESTVTQFTFVADSGASSHMMYSKQYLRNLEPCDNYVKVGNNSTMKCTAKGTYYGKVCKEDGTKINIILNDVMYVPEL